MTPVQKSDLLDLVAEHPGPHLSAFLPESVPAGAALAIRLGKRLRQGSNDWSGWYDVDSAELELTRHPELFREDGSASRPVVFLADGFTRVFDLDRNGTDRVVAGSHFYIKPVLASIQADRPFHLLTLSRRRAQLFRGSARGLTPVPVADLPAGVDDPALAQLHGKAHTLHTVGRSHGRAVEAAFHGHADGGSDRKHDLERFLRAVASAVTDALGTSTAPLVLAGVEEEMAVFRRVNTHPHLLAAGVAGSPDHRSITDLHADAWQLVQCNDPPYQQTLRLFHQLHGTGRTVEAIEDAVLTAADGMLGTVLVSPDRSVWGTFDPVRRRVETHTVRQPGDEELTNLATVHVLRHGGTVFLVPNGELGERSALGLRWLPMANHGKGGPS